MDKQVRADSKNTTRRKGSLHAGHMHPAERPHWHIDYLRKKTTLEAVWSCYDRKSREHAWAKRFAAMPGASVPMVGFGASDCDCESHLFYFKDCPATGGVHPGA